MLSSSQMDDRPIGFFDSGVGGLSILSEVHKLLPGERLLYVGDSAHFPYGALKPAHLRDLACSWAEFLLEHQAKIIVVACNTATVYALAHLRAAFPGVPFVGVVPVVKVLAERTRTGVIGLLSTPNTAKSAYLADLVERFADGKTLINVPCDGLADMVELGELTGPRLDGLLLDCLKPIVAGGADVLGLSCTHYPFLRPRIESLLSGSIQVYDSGVPVALRVRTVLDDLRALGDHAHPAHQLYTTGDSRRFAAVVSLLHGVPSHSLAHAESNFGLAHVD